MLICVVCASMALVLVFAALAVVPSASCISAPAPSAVPPAPKLLFPSQDSSADFSTVLDGITLNTAAIPGAIDTCSAQGGGMVPVAKTAAGDTCREGAISLKRGIHLMATALQGTITRTSSANQVPCQYDVLDHERGIP